MSDGWNSFKSYAKQTTESGQKRLIPVLGSGFNLQASDNSNDWISLLIEIGRNLGLSEDDMAITELSRVSTTAIWENFISKVALKRNESASDVERELKKIVQENLKKFESDHRNLSFYKSFIEIGFKDIISLNFDRTLALQYKHKMHKDTEDLLAPYSNYKRHLTTLFRHFELTNRFATRIWYPHGDTGKRDTIKLGIREYGIYIKSIEEASRRCLEKEIDFLKEHDFNYRSDRSIFDLETYKHYRNIWSNRIRSDSQLNWVWLMLNAPIVFLGCGLSWEEWPMWWLLHQRARHVMRIPAHEREPVFVFCNVNSTENKHMVDWLGHNPIDALLLPCDNWQEGWNKIMNILED